MTIKPVTQKRNAGDADKKDSHSHSGHGGAVVGGESANALNPQNVGRSATAHSHRSVVIDAHGQSPQRRGEVYDEVTRHRRSPHKSGRSKRLEHHNKRERNEREKLSTGNAGTAGSPSVGSGTDAGSPSRGSVCGSAGPQEHLGGLPVVLTCQKPATTPAAVAQAAANLNKAVEETFSGYNSGDEHLQPKEATISIEEWKRRDEKFAKCMSDRGYVLKPVEEDGACLFRSISLQIYGDEEMHDVIRQHTMDYIYKNREYFSHFVTEDINSYIKRKRRKDSHGNHIEIQAMSEIYSRPVEVYCYNPTPINIFNSEQLNKGYAPLRLSYQRGSHYNAILDPYNATVGVGLGLAGYKPDLQTKDAARLSEQLEIEQTMFEDKLKTTDWEATNEAIEEQIARESYLQWCRDNLQKSRAVATSTVASTSATVTSASAASDSEASPSKQSDESSSASGVAVGGTAVASLFTACHATAATVGSVCSASGNTSPAVAFAKLESAPGGKSERLNCGGGGQGVIYDQGVESDDTDMSSTSSLGNASPTSARLKKNKIRNGALRSSKKRRHEHLAKHCSEGGKNAEPSPRKSPKRDAVSDAYSSRAATPEAEQQPCTSKQSHTPKHGATAKGGSPPDATDRRAADGTEASNLYQELLEASYPANGFGQLSESEMLARAIQMSTHDYIEDQKRKYFYGP